MKRLIMALVALVAVCAAATAQQSQYFGVQPRVALAVSIDLGKPVTNHSEWYPGYDTGMGLSAGVLYNLPLGGKFFFEPSAEFYYHRWSSGNYYETWLDSDDGLSADIDYHTVGVTVPVQVGYRMEFSGCGLSFATGLAPRLGLSGSAEAKDKFDGGGEHILKQPLYGKDGPLHRAEIALPLSVTVDYGHWLFGVRLMLGLTDVQSRNDYDLHAHNRSVSLRVAYGL